MHTSLSQKTYEYADNIYESNNLYTDTHMPTGNAPTSFVTLDGNVRYNTNTTSTDATTVLIPNTSYNIIEADTKKNYHYNSNNNNINQNNVHYVNGLLPNNYVAPAMNATSTPSNIIYDEENNNRIGTTDMSAVGCNNILPTNTLTSPINVATVVNFSNNSNIINTNLTAADNNNSNSNSVKLNGNSSSTQIFSPTYSQRTR